VLKFQVARTCFQRGEAGEYFGEKLEQEKEERNKKINNKEVIDWPR